MAYKFSTSKKKKKVRKTVSKKVEMEPEDSTVYYKDLRLDKLLPPLLRVMGLLLGSAGMLRYRKEFEEEVRGIMDEKVKK